VIAIIRTSYCALSLEPLEVVGFFRFFKGVGEDYSAELGGGGGLVRRCRGGSRYVRHYRAPRKAAPISRRQS